MLVEVDQVPGANAIKGTLLYIETYHYIMEWYMSFSLSLRLVIG